MKTLILKYLTDSISDEEMESLKNWLKESQNQKIFESFAKNHFKLNLLLQNPDVERAYAQVFEQIRPVNRSRINLLRPWVRNAAIFIGVVITLGGFYFYMDSINTESNLEGTKITLELNDGTLKVLDESTSKIIVNSDGDKLVSHRQSALIYNDSLINKVDVEKLEYNQLTVPYGKKFQLILSDGTHVHLNSGSKLKYPVRFLPNENRNVILDGEAYFNVTENNHQPFTVLTPDMNTVVLGTQFNVSSYKDEDNTSTVLVEGSVRVEGTENKLINEITPGQRAIFKNESITIGEVNVDKHIAWTKNQLYFEDDRFEIIIKELERHFNVKIYIDNKSLNRKLFTGTFETETLEQILTAFQLHSNFEFESTTERTINIKPILK